MYSVAKPPAVSRSEASGGPATQDSEKNVRRVLVTMGADGSSPSTARA